MSSPTFGNWDPIWGNYSSPSIERREEMSLRKRPIIRQTMDYRRERTMTNPELSCVVLSSQPHQIQIRACVHPPYIGLTRKSKHTDWRHRKGHRHRHKHNAPRHTSRNWLAYVCYWDENANTRSPVAVASNWIDDGVGRYKRLNLRYIDCEYSPPK